MKYDEVCCLVYSERMLLKIIEVRYLSSTERRGTEKSSFQNCINSSHVTCIQWQEVNLAATIENLPKIRGRFKKGACCYNTIQFIWKNKQRRLGDIMVNKNTEMCNIQILTETSVWEKSFKIFYDHFMIIRIIYRISICTI